MTEIGVKDEEINNNFEVSQLLNISSIDMKIHAFVGSSLDIFTLLGNDCVETM